MNKLSFSAVFQPTALFSLKDSNSTNSGAKSLFIPSPYAIKMAILNQAITIGNVNFEKDAKKNEYFEIVRDTEIEYFIQGALCVNNCFIKILKPSRSKPGEVQETVSFREYIHLNEPIELIFKVSSEAGKVFLRQYIHKINYFGKRGCFFQFEAYKEVPSKPNVSLFEGNIIQPGILQEYDDFNEKMSFEHVNNFGGKSSAKREKKIFLLPLERAKASKAYTAYQVT